MCSAGLINEFDYDAAGTALALFQDNYLSVAHNGAPPIRYACRFAAPSNTGIPSGFDLNNDGTIGGPEDALGFGLFPGQFGMAVYSRVPIDTGAFRTFQTFRWKDKPGALLPDDPSTPAPADFVDFSDTAPDNLRTDYLLPAAVINIIDSLTFWPTSGSPLYRLTGDGVTVPLPS